MWYLYIVVIIPKVYLVPEAKPRDTKLPRVLLLLVNDSSNLLVPKAKPRNTNIISYYYFYSANVPNHLLMHNIDPWGGQYDLFLIKYKYQIFWHKNFFYWILAQK